MSNSSRQLDRREMGILVRQWIGVEGGYLGDFSYNSHDQFWMDVAGTYVDTNSFDGTARACFEDTVMNAEPSIQAKVLRAILEDYTAGAQGAPDTRTEQLKSRILGWASELEGHGSVDIQAAPEDASAIVKRALDDARSLMDSSGPQSAVDRVHTAMHGYLKSVCDANSIEYKSTATMAQIFKTIRKNHSAFDKKGPRQSDIERVLNSHANILDSLNPLRNNASVAHPNDDLLGNAEAVLVINTVNTLLAYIEMRVAENAGDSE